MVSLDLDPEVSVDESPAVGLGEEVLEAAEDWLDLLLELAVFVEEVEVDESQSPVDVYHLLGLD